MSDDLVKRLREAEVGEVYQARDGSPELQQTRLGFEAADLIEAQKVEIERLKAAIYKAVEYEEDRIKYDCLCSDCRLTLSKIGDDLRKALETK